MISQLALEMLQSWSSSIFSFACKALSESVDDIASEDVHGVVRRDVLPNSPEVLRHRVVWRAVRALCKRTGNRL